MPSAAPSVKPSPPPARPYAPWAGVLSYLVPGLGQIWQGRVAKGLLFLVCIYTLFFYGLYLGRAAVTVDKDGTSHVYRVSGSVYLPNTADGDSPLAPNTLGSNLYNRPQFLGQFWVGVAAWPALWQYVSVGKLCAELDQAADKREKAEIEKLDNQLDQATPLLGDFERTPSAEAINATHTSSDKRMELGWVYTVIAGVLNIMVIYDAIAGPAFLAAAAGPGRAEPQKAVA
jgi:hypothetical protein